MTPPSLALPFVGGWGRVRLWAAKSIALGVLLTAPASGQELVDVYHSSAATGDQQVSDDMVTVNLPGVPIGAGVFNRVDRSEPALANHLTTGLRIGRDDTELLSFVRHDREYESDRLRRSETTAEIKFLHRAGFVGRSADGVPLDVMLDYVSDGEFHTGAVANFLGRTGAAFYASYDPGTDLDVGGAAWHTFRLSRRDLVVGLRQMSETRFLVVSLPSGDGFAAEFKRADRVGGDFSFMELAVTTRGRSAYWSTNHGSSIHAIVSSTYVGSGSLIGDSPFTYIVPPFEARHSGTGLELQRRDFGDSRSWNANLTHFLGAQFFLKGIVSLDDGDVSTVGVGGGLSRVGKHIMGGTLGYERDLGVRIDAQIRFQIGGGTR